MYLSFVLVALVPPAVVTVISTVPVPAGATATIWLDVSDVIEVAAVAPNLTEVALPRLVPMIVTDVPPTAVPDEGETDVTVGAVT